MVFSGVHVKVTSVNGYGESTLNDPGSDKEFVTSVTVSDGVNGQPQGTVTLPLRSPATNKPHKDLIKPGDICVIEFLAHTPERKGWFLALHGPIRSVSERTVINDTGSESVCILTVGSFYDILAADAAAWFMYFYALKGVGAVRAQLTASETQTKPYEVAYNWLSKIALDANTYNPLGSLGTYLSLDFGGLQASTYATMALALAEGSHLQIISQFLDAPLHELYATVGTPSSFTGDLTKAASAGGGVKQPGAATILKWRAAPYKTCTLGGGAMEGDWNKLPLHKVSELQAVRERGSEYTLGSERNFFVCYPGYEQANEYFTYTRSVPVVNTGSIRRHGFRPLKLKTGLLINNEMAEPDLMEFIERLTWRLAGAWNNASQWENGTVSLPLSPWIKSGDRVQAISPWQSDRLYEYHVSARQMSWSAASGGSMVLNLERGFDVALNPTSYSDGLSKMQIDFNEVTQNFRKHDEPGF